ncbi:MAG TPA: DoxX family protein, partial [Chryseosolibacter sp.]
QGMPCLYYHFLPFPTIPAISTIRTDFVAITPFIRRFGARTCNGKTLIFVIEPKQQSMTTENAISLNQSTTTQTLSRGRLWASRIMSGLVILFMLVDSIFKFIQPAEVVQATTGLGYAAHHIATIGALGFVSIVLYLIPRTAVLGVIVLTGYFGGAIATHFRLDNPLFSHTLFPVYLAVLAWGGLWLRDQRVRRMFSRE